MVDFGYPNDEAAAAIGAYAPEDTALGKDPGFTEKAVNDISNWIDNNQPKAKDAPAPDYSSHFSAEENAAYEWYEENVVPTDKWKNLVSDYQSKVAQESTTNPTFDPTTTYVPSPDSTFNPPASPAGDLFGPDGKPHSGQVVVSIDAINNFINELAAIAGDGTGVLPDAKAKLSDIDLKPGKFARAELLRQKIMGGPNMPGLRNSTIQILDSLQSTLFDLQGDLKKIVSTYHNSEDLKKLTATELDQAMQETTGKINHLKGLGSDSSNDAQGSGKGGGSQGGGPSGS